MPYFHNQYVDFHGMIGDTLEAPLVIEGESSNVVVGSDECPSLGPKCVKMTMADTSSFLAITDNELIMPNRNAATVGFAYRALSMETPPDWGEDWTIGLMMFFLGFQPPIEYAGVISDSLCRAIFLDHGHARALEAEDMRLGLEQAFDIENSGDYFVAVNYRIDYPTNGITTFRMLVKARGASTIIAEKTWTVSGDGASRYLSLGPMGYRAGSRVPYPQDIFFTDLVVDYTNAVWPLLDYTPTFTVTFSDDGGSPVSPQVIDNGGLVVEPVDPTKEHYTFDGWYRDWQKTVLWNFATDTVTEDRTLYAKYVIDSFVVTFNSLGGSSVAPITAEYSSVIEAPTPPTRANYAFGGWYREEACTTAWVFDNDQVEEAITLYAKWTLLTNRMTFDSQGGSSAQAQDVGVGQPVATIPIPSRTGFDFLGWFTQVEGAGVRVLATTIPTTDITVYAAWIATTAPVGICRIVPDDGVDDSVNEGSAKAVGLSFVDANGAPITPLSIVWSLYTRQGIVVNSRSSVPVEPASHVRIILSGADHVSSAWRTERIIVIHATYTSTDGAALPLVGAFGYFVGDIIGA